MVREELASKIWSSHKSTKTIRMKNQSPSTAPLTLETSS